MKTKLLLICFLLVETLAFSQTTFTKCGTTFTQPWWAAQTTNGDTALVIDNNGNLWIKAPNLHYGAITQTSFANSFFIKNSSEQIIFAFNTTDAYITNVVVENCLQDTLNNYTSNNLVIRSSAGEVVARFSEQTGSIYLKGAFACHSISPIIFNPNLTYGTVADIDGNSYRTIQIGTQNWMAENLRVTHYRNGDLIPNVTDNTQWAGLTTGAYCWYNNDYLTYGSVYGALYNWYTVTDSRNLCPTGWHVPNYEEWDVLSDYLGVLAGGKMKEISAIHWHYNSGATNESGFTGLPGGIKDINSYNFDGINGFGYWWNSTPYDVGNAWCISLIYSFPSLYYNNSFEKKIGLSARCIQNSIPSVSNGVISNPTQTSATCGGFVTADGGEPVTERGVCWATTQNPTTANSKTTDGSGTGTFTSNLTGLTPNTTYYVRAYATNNIGTAYGNEVSFTTTNLPAFEMVDVAGGSFQMGCGTGTCNSRELPVHTVTLSSFRISKYEVTQQQYLSVMGSNPSRFTGDLNRPVEQVNWYEALAFCNKLSMFENRSPCYIYTGYGTNPDLWPSGWNSGTHNNIICNFAANGYRLPTEAEWEYAARGGTHYTDNYLYSGSNDPDAVSWCQENSGGTTHAVGTKAPNQLGIYDMTGNVMEWCWDWYETYTSSSQTNPTGPTSGSFRMRRDGCYWFFCGVGAVFQRLIIDGECGNPPNFRYYGIGFRLVFVP